MALEDQVSYDQALTCFSRHKIFDLNRCLRRRACALKSLDDLETARNIYYWVRAEIEYNDGFFIKKTYLSAKKVHKRRRGVCLDQSILYVAVAREAGLESCIAYEGNNHAVAVVRINNDVSVFDVGSGGLEIRELHRYRPVPDHIVADDFVKINRAIRIVNMFKRFIVGLVLSGSLNFSSDYWYTEKVDYAKKETVSLIEHAYSDVKSLYGHCADYFSNLKRIFE